MGEGGVQEELEEGPEPQCWGVDGQGEGSRRLGSVATCLCAGVTSSSGKGCCAPGTVVAALL